VDLDPALPPHVVIAGDAVVPEAPPHAEGYTLRIDRNGVALAGYDVRGLVWGLVSLCQLIRQTRRLPCGEVVDWPEYRVRYHHDDISRRQVSTLSDFLRVVRDLGSLKFSHYTLYMEDLFELPGEPQFGCGRGALTLADIRAIVAEGERRQVEVFPTVSLLGHQESMLKLPCYRALGARVWQPPSSFDPSVPAVRDHILKVLDTLCPLFTSSLFHMGFDETQGVEAERFLEHANWCAERLAERGKTPLFWADMLYNHFGLDLLDRMHPALTPVVWDYGPRGGRAREVLPELLRRRPGAWVLAGYRTNRTFLHDPIEELFEQWRNWRAVADPARTGGFGASQWVDDGDNLRDAVWHLVGAFSEQAWSGENGDPGSVESRFNTVYYGHALPELVRLRTLLANGLALTPAEAWKLHMLPAPGWVRLAHAGKLPAPDRITESLDRLAEGRRWLSSCRRHGREHWAELGPWSVALGRMEAVFHGVLAAHARTQDACRVAQASLRKARSCFRSTWLAHNKPEGIEHVLATFDEQIRHWAALPPREAPRHVRWHPVDLGKVWNTFREDVAGIPLGVAEVGGVPFRFAGSGLTHVDIPCGETVSIALPTVPLRDLHLVVTQARESDVPGPGARLRLFREGRLVFEEELSNVRHLCDWWAPLGEHMWAGGGLSYVDPVRVRWLLKPNLHYGLTVVSRFPWHAAPEADRLELTGLSRHPVQLFALTLEEARRQ
jgi:hypothetical protein